MIGAILAGGASRRMGRPKQTLELGDGRPMIEHVREHLAAVCDDVVTVGGDGADIPDGQPGQGPMAGLDALLSSGRDERYLVCPCDMPLVTAEMFASLAESAGDTPAAFRVEGESKFRPLPLYVPTAVRDDVARHLNNGRRVVRELLRETGVRVVDVPEGWATRLEGINTPAEYEALLAGGV